jgi:hypothetical protein
MEKILTAEQFRFIGEAFSTSLEKAKETLQKEKQDEASKVFGETIPKDKHAEKYISAHAKELTSTFLSELNKNLHSLAGAIIKKTPKKEK